MEFSNIRRNKREEGNDDWRYNENNGDSNGNEAFDNEEEQYGNMAEKWAWRKRGWLF